jgi:hypothetical protein
MYPLSLSSERRRLIHPSNELAERYKKYIYYGILGGKAEKIPNSRRF